MAIEETKIYEESCAAFRHYSNAVMTIRTLTFAQGFAVLTATGFLVHQNEQALSIITILFGLFFTAVLGVLHWNYFTHANNVLDFLVPFEKEHSPVKEGFGPWNSYAKTRNKYVKSFLGKELVVQGPYLLFVSAFVTALVWSVTQ